MSDNRLTVICNLVINVKRSLCVLYFFNNSLESGGVVESEVGEYLAVDLDACFVNQAHEFGIREVLFSGGGVDTLYPQCAECALFVFAVAVGVGKTLFPSVLGYGPYILTASEVTAGEF